MPEHEKWRTEACYDPSWQIPACQHEIFWQKSAEFCLIIPVINEGPRIGKLLQRLLAPLVCQDLDVVIIDAGSTDGSMRAVGQFKRIVRGVLRLDQPEGLSAQLRCAYAFALAEGYRGVITIDGNDKDDPATLPHFVALLRHGVDFIQASRFIDGGFAENTPWLRTLAIRRIHAPLIAYFSGFPWTDTTQGFRGYSQKLLVHPQICPFRRVFVRYELLAYLSVRAPQVGLKCAEVATTRRYPKTGRVPTKISHLRGNWLVLSTLLKACAGRYNV